MSGHILEYIDATLCRFSHSNHCFSDYLELNTPVVGGTAGTGERFLSGMDEEQRLEDMDDAIAIATSNLGLVAGTAFQARVAQLAMLNTAHKTVSTRKTSVF